MCAASSLRATSVSVASDAPASYATVKMNPSDAVANHMFLRYVFLRRFL